MRVRPSPPRSSHDRESHGTPEDVGHPDQTQNRRNAGQDDRTESGDGRFDHGLPWLASLFSLVSICSTIMTALRAIMPRSARMRGSQQSPVAFGT